jgi:hypothetical protein
MKSITRTVPSAVSNSLSAPTSPAGSIAHPCAPRPLARVASAHAAHPLTALTNKTENRTAATQPVNRALAAHQSLSLHVTEQAIVLDKQRCLAL